MYASRFFLQGGPVKWSSLLDRETVRLGVTDRFREGSSIERDFLWYAAIQCVSTRRNAREITYPTFTQVPPKRLDSTIIALTPYLELAMRPSPNRHFHYQERDNQSPWK